MRSPKPSDTFTGRRRKRLVEVKGRQLIDIEQLRFLTDRMTMQAESAGEFIRRMRD